MHCVLLREWPLWFSIFFMGDFFKIAAWLAYVVLVKVLKYHFIIEEIVFSTNYIFFCYFFIEQYGLIGAAYCFCADNISLRVFMFSLVGRYITVFEGITSDFVETIKYWYSKRWYLMALAKLGVGLAITNDFT